MRVDAPEPVNAVGVTVPSLYRPHPRYRSAVTGIPGAVRLPTVTVNRLNQYASGTLSPPGSHTPFGWPLGRPKTSISGVFDHCGQRTAMGKPRTSRTAAVTASGHLGFQNTRRLSERV